MPVEEGQSGVLRNQCSIGVCQPASHLAHSLLELALRFSFSGGRCNCHAFSACAFGVAGCVRVFECKDKDKLKRCTKIDSCVEKLYDTTAELTLDCGVDLTTLSQAERGALSRQLKIRLVDLPNCNFKPCGYKLETGHDVRAVDDNTIEFAVQGNTVSRWL